MGAIKREMNNGKWTLAAIGYMCGFAYVMSLIVYQIGGLLTGEAAFGVGTLFALAFTALIIYMMVRKGYQEQDNNILRSVEASGKV